MGRVERSGRRVHVQNAAKTLRTVMANVVVTQVTSGVLPACRGVSGEGDERHSVVSCLRYSPVPAACGACRSRGVDDGRHARSRTAERGARRGRDEAHPTIRVGYRPIRSVRAYRGPRGETVPAAGRRGHPRSCRRAVRPPRVPKTSVQDVADAVGLSKAGLLHHFPSKDALTRRCSRTPRTLGRACSSRSAPAAGRGAGPAGARGAGRRRPGPPRDRRPDARAGRPARCRARRAAGGAVRGGAARLRRHAGGRRPGAARPGHRRPRPPWPC